MRPSQTTASLPARANAAIRPSMFDPQFVLRWGAAVVIACSLTAISERPAISQQAIIVDVNAVAQGFRVSKLLGKPVVNDQNQNLGTLDDIIMSTDKKQLFAVLQVGSFLGLGGHLIAVQLDNLMIPPDATKVMLAGANKDTLTKLPEFIYRQP